MLAAMRRSVLVSLALPLFASLTACSSNSPEGNDDVADESSSESTEGNQDSTDQSESTDQAETDETGSEAYTYWRDAKAILDRACVGCHLEGGIGPFGLETYAKAYEVAPILTAAISEGTMPPWPPADGCSDYAEPRTLTDEERDILLGWIDAGAPEGDPSDAPPDQQPEPFEPDFTVTLPVPYTPTASPDDYRCFVIDWPAEITQDQYVVAEQVFPDQSALVHHVIMFVAGPDEADFYVGLDEQEEGPGYTCFGGPGKLDWSARWLGAWVPGMTQWNAPTGTGVRVEAGSKLIVQMHYNLLAGAPAADQTSIGFKLQDQVEQPAEFIPIVDYGWVTGSKPMPIPAGEANVTHEVTLGREHPFFLYVLAALGVGPTDPVDVWNAALHMHMLGTQARVEVQQGGGSDDCLLQIDDWDFHWQGQYELAAPVEFGAGDSIHLQCWWDNTAENQPLVDGVPKQPADAGWGEGTFDEMCLGVLLVARK